MDHQRIKNITGVEDPQIIEEIEICMRDGSTQDPQSELLGDSL